MLRRTIAALGFAALAILAATGAALIPHEPPACGGAADTPLPWVQAMRAGCGR